MPDENEKTYSNPLRKSMTRRYILFTALLAFAVGFVGLFIYYEDMLEYRQNYAMNILNLTARQIDGDDLAKCIATKKKSQKYLELQKFMDLVQDEHEFEYLYIALPLAETPPKNMMWVMTAKIEKQNPNFDLGGLSDYEYPESLAKQYMKRMDNKNKVTFFRNNTLEYGRMYTAIRPILNSSGEPVAVLCGDIPAGEMDKTLYRYILMTLISAGIFSTILVYVMSRWLNSRVAVPIAELEKSARAFAQKCSVENGNKPKIENLKFDDPNIRTGDEIESLAETLKSMCRDIKIYAENLIEMKERVSQMDIIAYRDPLTGAGNKAAYEKAVARLDWGIVAENTNFAIVMLDLNYLKKINDNYGHDNGNLYIKKMYDMLVGSFVDSPIFRVGGDEFVVIAENDDLENCTNIVVELKSKMYELAERSDLKEWEKVSMAIGVAIYDPWLDGCADDVFRRADAAMYEDKRAMKAGRE